MYQEERLPHAAKRYAPAINSLLEVTEKLPQVKLGLVHLFSKGYYARVLKIPAGTLVVAKLHKTRHYAALVSGSMRITDGDRVQDVCGPTASMSPIGSQRVGHALSDCVYMTLHKTQQTTLAAIEAEVIATSQEELCLGR